MWATKIGSTGERAAYTKEGSKLLRQQWQHNQRLGGTKRKVELKYNTPLVNSVFLVQ